jgi:hypothetical protein
MYTHKHDVYPFAHLKHAGWYLNCSKGFVPPSEVHLFTSFNAEAPADVVFHKPVVPEESVKGTKASKAVKEPKSKKVKAVSGTQASQATTTRKNGSVPTEFQQNSVDVTSWFGTFDSDNF